MYLFVMYLLALQPGCITKAISGSNVGGTGVIGTLWGCNIWVTAAAAAELLQYISAFGIP